LYRIIVISSGTGYGHHRLEQHKGKHGGSDRGRFSAAGMETAASVGTTSRFVAHWVESTKTVVSHGLRRATSAKSLTDDPHIRTGTVKSTNRSGRQGISDAANDGNMLDQECQSYIDAMKHRERAMTEETVIQLLMHTA
jgi:hypothetical protein